MLEPAGKSGHVIASQIQQQYNFSLPEKVSKMLCLLNSCEVADFSILSCAAGIYVIVCPLLPLPSSPLYEPDEVVNASGWEERRRATSDPILQGSGSTPPQLMLPSPVPPPVHLLLFLLLSFHRATRRGLNLNTLGRKGLSE